MTERGSPGPDRDDGKKMHPLFVKLYLNDDPDDSEEEQPQRKRKPQKQALRRA
jgi:hypothetical protein